MSQLALNYRESALSVSVGHSGELRAGDRLPDLPITLLHSEGSSDTQARPATIFSLLNPSFFTLLYCNIPDPAKTGAATLERRLSTQKFNRLGSIDPASTIA
jgi:hypothetical protein